MDKRIYNVVFDLHTVAGIIISVALYVIFFAGSLSFIKNEITAWETNNSAVENYFDQTNFNQVFLNLDKTDTLATADVSLRFLENSSKAYAFISPHQPTESEAEAIKNEETSNTSIKSDFFILDLKTLNKAPDYDESYNLGEFFYRLHFFAQLNLWGRSGYFFAGFVSLFFLFTLITGIIIHWDKIKMSFFVFRPRAKWKTIWTDAHVGLGLIGFPFQFIYALTGCYLIFATILVQPTLSLFQKEKAEQISENLFDDTAVQLPLANVPITKPVDYNSFIKKAQQEFPTMHLREVSIGNYGDQNMFITIVGQRPFAEKFTGKNAIVYRISSGEVLKKTTDTPSGYKQGLDDVVNRLHYGDYGGYGLKILYIILGFIGCFVIISGVLIWFVARDKKATSEKKRKQNRWVLNVYLAICLSMLPVTAFTFCIVKIFGADVAIKKVFIYQVFFYSWLLLSLFFIWRREVYFTNKACLLLGGVLSLMVVFTDGIITGNWLWVSFYNQDKQIFATNFFWLLLAITNFWVLIKLRKPSNADV